MSSIAMTPVRPSVTLRVAVALGLAVLVHLSALQALAGIRVLLPTRAPPQRMIDVALLPPPQAPVALPSRRAVVRAAAPGRSGSRDGIAPLTAVRTDAWSRRRATRVARAAAPAPRPHPVQPASAPAPAAGGAGSGATPEPAQAAPPVQPPIPGEPVATAAPAAPPETPAPKAAPEGAPAPAGAPVPAAGQVPAAGEAPAAAAASAGAPVAYAAPASAATSAATAAAAMPAHAAVQVILPKSARFVYDSYGTVRVGGFMLGVRGRTTTRWRFEDGHYRSDLSIDVVSFSQSSQGKFDPDFGLEPERYSETRPRRPISTTQFDWANHSVSFAEDNRQGEAEPGTQDRLSVQFQLSVLRQVYPERFVRGSVVPITLAGTRDVSHWTFTVTGEEIVDSGLGRLPALRVLSNRTTASGDESLEVWIAEKLDWFPVRIRIVDKNRNVIDSVLDQASID